jgi:hypothetical protein
MLNAVKHDPFFQNFKHCETQRKMLLKKPPS